MKHPPVLSKQTYLNEKLKRNVLTTFFSKLDNI